MRNSLFRDWDKKFQSGRILELLKSRRHSATLPADKQTLHHENITGLGGRCSSAGGSITKPRAPADSARRYFPAIRCTQTRMLEHGLASVHVIMNDNAADHKLAAAPIPRAHRRARLKAGMQMVFLCINPADVAIELQMH